jgi:hypothetical protein
VVTLPYHRSCLRVALLGSLPLLTGASCRPAPADCTHASNERCLWEQAVVAPMERDGELEGGELGGDSDGADPSERAELEQTLTSIIDIMQLGLEWPLVDERARGLCSQRDAEGEVTEAPITPADGSADGEADAAALAWSCPVANLELDGESLTLEASQGVISLSTSDLDAARSEQLQARARTGFAPKCLGAFEEIEGAKLEVFHRCSLPEGPYLVIARFPRDVEANLWQVSIAVVDAG